MKILVVGFVVIFGFWAAWAGRRPARFSGNLFVPVCLLGLALVTGCASRSKEMWNSRVGSYTVKQAAKDLGRPEHATMLADGSQVASWMTHAGSRGSLTYYGSVPLFAARTFDYPMWRDAPYVPDQYLRLMFGPDGKLVAWDRQYK